MHTIIGLGNPGQEYALTRHNIGFMVVDELARRHDGAFRKGKGAYLAGKIAVQGQPVLLIKPTTFMNLSGQAARQVVEFYKITDIAGLLVVVDEFNLPYGTIRCRPSGSAGGQKGLKSILQTLHTNDISRLRVGIGSGFNNASSFVLSPFSRQEQKDLPQVIAYAADATEAFICQGIETAMNNFNRQILA